MREIRRIILHCSDSPFGDVDTIRQWHMARGWRNVGYHHVVLNGQRTLGGGTSEIDDGVIERGRAHHVMGAHVRGHNRDTLGICLIGTGGYYTVRQIRATVALVRELLAEYDLTAGDVYGHRDLDPAKTCPDFRTEDFRALL